MEKKKLRNIIILGGTLVLAIGLGFFGTKIVSNITNAAYSPEQAASEVEQSIKAQYGEAPNISCSDKLPLQQGSSITCNFFENSGKKYNIIITVTSIKNGQPQLGYKSSPAL